MSFGDDPGPIMGNTGQFTRPLESKPFQNNFMLNNLSPIETDGPKKSLTPEKSVLNSRYSYSWQKFIRTNQEMKKKLLHSRHDIWSFTFSILLKCVKVHTYIIKLLIFCLYGKTWTKDIASRTFLCLISVVYSSPTYFITKLPCWPEIYQETPLSALLCHIIWTNWQLFAWFFSIEVVFQLPVNERWAFYLLRLLIETTYFWQVQQKSSCEASIYWHQYCEVSLAICLVFLKE